MTYNQCCKYYVTIKKRIKKLEGEIEKNTSLCDYFDRNHLFTLKNIVLTKLKKQKRKFKKYLDDELTFVNSKIARRKKYLELLSLCRTKLASHIDPELARMYMRRHYEGRF